MSDRRPARLLGDVVPITPTSLERWQRCRREYLIADLLGVPDSDDGPSNVVGLLVHDLLRFVHVHGSCADGDHVEAALEAHGVDSDVIRSMLARHARRCPAASATTAAHEVDLVRFHRTPAPMFMASARIDALWVHDGVLDLRDYKTGMRRTDRLAEDRSARLQAYVAANHARRRGLQVQVRYEYLAPEVLDDPEPFVPDDDDLLAIEVELQTAVTEIRTEHQQGEWAGIAERDTCRSCRFRSVCAYSAAPGEAGWPALALLETDERHGHR